MPWMHAIYTDTAQRKLAEHGVSEDEVEQVLQGAQHYTTSRSSGLPLAQGWTEAGRWLVVVYRALEDLSWPTRR